MKEGLELLHDLQGKDDLLKNIEKIIDDIPKKIKQIEEERDSKKSIIEDSKKKLNINMRERKKLEENILQIKEKVSRYKEQMNKSTTNREYQGFISEIKYEEDKIKKIEEDIIEKMLESDDIMQEIRDREKEYESIALEYEKKISDNEGNLEYYKDKNKVESESRGKLRNIIPKDLIRIYDSLFIKKGGKAISSVETEFCGVCNVKLRPQLLNEVIATNSIFMCENCGRILFKIIKEETDEEKSV